MFKKILLITVICFFFVGCNAIPKRTWTISQIRPDGNVQKTWVIERRIKPRVRGGVGGRTMLVTRGRTIYAPTGWALQVDSNE